MYKGMAVFNGVLITLMITFNGLLGSSVGNQQSLIIIHLIGLLCSIGLLIGCREKMKNFKGLPPYLFLGGAIGIFNVLFNNLSFNALGATLTLSLNLIGQLITSMIFDHYGLLGLSVNKVNKTKLAGVGIMSIGIISMIFI